MAVYSWGFGKYGQLGNGLTDTAETPQLMRLPKSTTPLQISCGAHYTLLLCAVATGDGVKKHILFACGWGKHGRLGTGTEDDHTHPAPLALPDTPEKISAGFWHAACLSTDGVLYAWGYNRTHNVLGGLIKGAPPIQYVPVRAMTDLRFKYVSCGYNFTYAVGIDGSCWSWGSGSHGVLSYGDTLERTTPTRIDVPGNEPISFVDCGYSHVAVVTENGKLFMAGHGGDGALGVGGKSDRHRLCHVTALDAVAIDNASCSLGERHGHSLACTKSGEVFSWGDGYKGKLGHGDQESKELPTQIDASSFCGECVKSVKCGGIHSAAVTREGGVYTWGCGSDGRLGHPESKGHRYLFRSDVPRRVDGLSKPCTDVHCSYYHSIALSN